MNPRHVVHVYGPAYLDRVVRIDHPLVDPDEPPLDQSVDGVLKFGDGFTLRDPSGSRFLIHPPPNWPGPFGKIELDRSIGAAPGGWTRSIRGRAWQDDLGGMGAGYAKVLEGTLHSALGSPQDPMSGAVEELLKRFKIKHNPIRVPTKAADWTLLFTSGPFGDKLPIGFRGCHAAMKLSEQTTKSDACDLRVVASLPNAIASKILRTEGAIVRMFAPTTRNMIDQEAPLAKFADAIDILSCNKREWESLEGREQVAWLVSILAVTDGPNGCVVRFTTPQGEPGRLELPPFPRKDPPRDTNRAGEAFGATLVKVLLDLNWSHGVAEESLMRHAVERASAAAALVLDRLDFGFPSSIEIDAALRAGWVSDPDDARKEHPGYNVLAERAEAQSEEGGGG